MLIKQKVNKLVHPNYPITLKVICIFKARKIMIIERSRQGVFQNNWWKQYMDEKRENA